MKLKRLYNKDNFEYRLFSCLLIIGCCLFVAEVLNYQNSNRYNVIFANQISDTSHKMQLLQNQIENLEIKLNDVENRISDLNKAITANSITNSSNNIACSLNSEVMKLKTEVAKLANNVIVLLEKSDIRDTQNTNNARETWKQKLSDFFAKGFAFSRG